MGRELDVGMNWRRRRLSTRCAVYWGVVEQTAIRPLQRAKGVLLAYSDSQHGGPAIGLCGECNGEG